MENKAATCLLFGYSYANNWNVVVADAADVEPTTSAHMHEISLYLEAIDMRAPQICICGVSIVKPRPCV